MLTRFRDRMRSVVRRCTSMVRTVSLSAWQSILWLGALLVAFTRSAGRVIKRGAQHGWQMLRWLLAPLVSLIPGAWIVTTVWTFGIVLLTERVFPPARWFLMSGIVYLSLIILKWVIHTCHPRIQRVVACIVVVSVGMMAWLLVQSIIDVVEAKTYVTVEFKSSPLLTAKRQKHIRRALTSFHDYLTAIGFDIPKKVPFLLGTTPRKTSLTTSMGSIPGSPYDTFKLIPEHAIRNDELIQEAYALFVFGNLLIQYEPVFSNFYTMSSERFAIYYVASYRGINLCSETDKWCQTLWAIQQRYGKEFTDKLLFYAFQKWEQASTSESNFDAYFMRRFSRGLRDAANDADKQVPIVIEILKQRGLDPE